MPAVISIVRSRWPAMLLAAAPGMLLARSVEILLWTVGSGGSGALINDRVVRPIEHTWTPLAGMFIVSIGWAVSLVAAVAVAGGWDGSPWRAIATALRRIPIAASLPLAMALGSLWGLASGVSIMVLISGAIVVLCAHALDVRLEPVFVVLGLIAVGSIGYQISQRLTRLGLVAPVSVADDRRGWAAYRRALDLSREVKRVDLLGPGIALLVGIIACVLRTDVLAAPVAAYSPAMFGADVILAALICAQAALLTAAHSPHRLAASRRRTPSPQPLLPAIAAALLVIPSLAASALVIANPYRLPRWQLVESNLDGALRAAAWPEGQHPIIVTGSYVMNCLDDQCARHSRWRSAMPPSATVAVGTDGVILLSIMERGVLRLDRCSRGGACKQSDIRWPADPGLVLAVPAPDGALLVAGARRETGDRAVLSLTRCPDLTCARPEVLTEQTVTGAAIERRDLPTVLIRPDGLPELRIQKHDPRTLARTDDGRYALIAAGEPGLDDTPAFGPFNDVARAAPSRRQMTMVECLEPGCDRPGRQWRLNIFEHAQPTAIVVVRADRHALIAEATDRLVIATARLQG